MHKKYILFYIFAYTLITHLLKVEQTANIPTCGKCHWAGGAIFKQIGLAWLWDSLSGVEDFYFT